MIIPYKKLSGICSVSKKVFINSNNKSFNSSQKVFKNSLVKSPGPGLVLFLVLKICLCNSFKFVCESSLELSSSVTSKLI